MYKIEFTKDDINKLGAICDIAVRQSGLQNPDITKFALDVMERCTVAILEGDAKMREKVEENLDKNEEITKKTKEK